jgi:nucleotide-binding universal stress UspA family protein
MKKRILVALDLGFDSGWERRARMALDHALRLADVLGLGIDLVHVAEMGTTGATQKGALSLMRRFADDQKSRLKQLSTEYRDAQITPLFMKGDPIAKLIQLAAKKSQYECLVMATHGRTGIARMLLGSVAEEVIRHSKVPVFCIGAAAQQPSTAKMGSGPNLHPCVIVATDLGVNSHKAEKLALDWARKMKAGAVLYHSLREGVHPVIQAAYGAGRGSSEFEALLAPHRLRAKKGLELRARAWHRSRLECEIYLDESFKSAEDGILELAQARNASLIILGTHGRNLASRAFLGSTAREVVLRSTVPTVTQKS